jgi:hypothetical protein
MKKPLVIAFLTFIIIVACTNRDGEIIDLINSVKKQNDDLKAQITALKKTTDSALVAVLKVNSMQSATERKIDLIQTDLKTILPQISSLTSQMTSTNADLVTLKAKIDALQAKCAELVAQIALLNGSSAQINLKEGLLAYYPFNGNANDISGNSNNGTVYEAALTNNRFGNSKNAYYFSSQNCSPRIEASVNTISITKALTISIWVKQVGNGCISPRILDFASSPIDGPGQLQWTFGYQNSWAVSHAFADTSGVNSNLYSTGPFVWTHLVYSNDGTTCKFYQDGKLLGTKLFGTGKPILARNLTIGRMNHPAFDAFDGNLDDLGIWNRALTAEEIKFLYENDFKP